MRWCYCGPVVTERQGTATPVLRFSENVVSELPRGHGRPPLTGCLKASPEDFQVQEVLGYGPSGEGEHLILQVRKRGWNTLDVARRLAEFAGVHPRDVGFAGLKDRQALTVQAFSVRLPRHEALDWEGLSDEALEVRVLGWHRSKLRRGDLRGNRFQIRLTGIEGDREHADVLLERIARAGFPNYFGEQRFGRGSSNLIRAQSLLLGRLRRPRPEQLRMLVSAARAYLFNQVLAERVECDLWRQPLAGEVLETADERRHLLASTLDTALISRVREGELHPTGPLPGRGGRRLAPEGEAAALENAVLGRCPFPVWVSGLADRGIDADRRVLRIIPAGMTWEWVPEGLVLDFELPAGCYATSLVRELLDQRPALRESST